MNFQWEWENCHTRSRGRHSQIKGNRWLKALGVGLSESTRVDMRAAQVTSPKTTLSGECPGGSGRSRLAAPTNTSISSGEGTCMSPCARAQKMPPARCVVNIISHQPALWRALIHRPTVEPSWGRHDSPLATCPLTPWRTPRPAQTGLTQLVTVNSHVSPRDSTFRALLTNHPRN